MSLALDSTFLRHHSYGQTPSTLKSCSTIIKQLHAGECSTSAALIQQPEAIHDIETAQKIASFAASWRSRLSRSRCVELNRIATFLISAQSLLNHQRARRRHPVERSKLLRTAFVELARPHVRAVQRLPSKLRSFPTNRRRPKYSVRCKPRCLPSLLAIVIQTAARLTILREHDGLAKGAGR